MGFLGRLLGIENETDRRPPPVVQASGGSEDEYAIERYRYMVRTAPPETLEQAYAEAFAKLTPEQREKVRLELSGRAPQAEQAAIAATPLNDTQALARSATRAEVREPGTMERALNSGSIGSGFGGNLLSSFAMGFVGSMVAQSFFSAVGGFGSEPQADASDAEDGDDAEDFSDDVDVDV